MKEEIKTKMKMLSKFLRKKLNVFVAKTDLTRIHRIGKFSPWRNTRSNKKIIGQSLHGLCPTLTERHICSIN